MLSHRSWARHCSPHKTSAEAARRALCTGVSWRPAGASLLWLHHALASLDADLRARHGPGAGIVYRRGPYASSLVAIAEAAAAGVVHFSRRYEPAMQAR